MFNWAKQTLANVAGTAEPIYGPSAIRSVALQSEKTPYSIPPKSSLQWIAKESDCVETQVWYLMLESGHLIVLQVIYSVIAIKKTCQFNSKIFYPDRTKPSLWSSDELKSFEFDEERYSCYSGDNVAVTLSEDGTEYKIKSMSNMQAIVDVTVKKAGPAFCAGSDGQSFYGTDPKKPWGSMRHIFWPRNTVSGQIITKEGPIECKGTAMYIMAIQGMKPHHAAARWNFVNFQSPKYTATLMEFTTPPSYGETSVPVGGIISADEVVLAGTDCKIEHTEVKHDKEVDWPEPQSVKVTWKGKTADGKEASAILETSLGERRDRVDVMAEVPGFIKSLASNVVGTRPYIYQYILDATLKLTIDGQTTEEQGKLLSEATFIS